MNSLGRCRTPNDRACVLDVATRLMRHPQFRRVRNTLWRRLWFKDRLSRRETGRIARSVTEHPDVAPPDGTVAVPDVATPRGVRSFLQRQGRGRGRGTPADPPDHERVRCSTSTSGRSAPTAARTTALHRAPTTTSSSRR